MTGTLPLQLLREFLVSSFDEDELRRVLGDRYGPRLVRSLPFGGPLVRVCEEAVATLERQGLIDDDLFAALAGLLPAKRGQVERLAEAWRQVTTAPACEPRPTTTRPAIEGYMYAILELAPESRARRAVMLHEGSCECGVGLLGLPRGGGSLELVARDSAVLLSAQGADVFVRLRGPYVLRDHDRFLLGDTLVEVRLAGHPLVKLHAEQDPHGLVVPLTGTVRLGRAVPLVRPPQDPRMSRQHAQIDLLDDGPGFLLIDLGSANGTWVRIRERHRFTHGDEFRAHDATFRVEVTLRR
mgnify:CR=1 FL=1